jgi:hypothetical protein
MMSFMKSPDINPSDKPTLTEQQRLAAIAIQEIFLSPIRTTEHRSPTPEEIDRAWDGAVHEVTLPVEQRDRYNS